MPDGMIFFGVALHRISRPLVQTSERAPLGREIRTGDSLWPAPRSRLQPFREAPTASSADIWNEKRLLSDSAEERVMLSKNTAIALVAMAGAAITALSSMGCSIHVQAPVREVAYDYSDYHFYDRNYAPSPNYAPAAAYVSAHVVQGSDGAAEGASCDGAASAGDGVRRRPAHAVVTGKAGTRHRMPRVQVGSPAGNPSHGMGGASAPEGAGGLKLGRQAPVKRPAVATSEPRAEGFERY